VDRIRAVSPTLHLIWVENRGGLLSPSRVPTPEFGTGGPVSAKPFRPHLGLDPGGHPPVYHPPDGSLTVGLESGSLLQSHLNQNVKSNAVRQQRPHDN
jgi:hypothetical protein